MNDGREQIESLLPNLLPADGATVGNATLFQSQVAAKAADFRCANFDEAHEALVAAGLVSIRRGRVGPTRRPQRCMLHGLPRDVNMLHHARPRCRSVLAAASLGLRRTSTRPLFVLNRRARSGGVPTLVRSIPCVFFPR